MKKMLERKDSKAALDVKYGRLLEEKRGDDYHRWLERSDPWVDEWKDWPEVENKWPDPVESRADH